jgi:hypothetical protein
MTPGFDEDIFALPQQLNPQANPFFPQNQNENPQNM